MCPYRFTNLIFFFIYIKQIWSCLKLLSAGVQCLIQNQCCSSQAIQWEATAARKTPIFLPLHASPRAAVSVRCLQPHPLEQTRWACLRQRERTDPLCRDVSVLWRALRDRTWRVRKALGAAASLRLTRSVTTLSLIKSLNYLNWER